MDQIHSISLEVAVWRNLKDRKNRKSRKRARRRRRREKKKAAEKPVEKKVDENFRYIVRIMNSDIDGNKSLMMGIQNVKGVGPRVAAVVARRTGIKPAEKMGNLSEAQTDEIEKIIASYPEFAPHWAVNRQNDVETGEDLHVFGIDLGRCQEGRHQPHEDDQKLQRRKARAGTESSWSEDPVQRKDWPYHGCQQTEGSATWWRCGPRRREEVK